MKNKIKVLILGIGQSNFLNQLYGAVRNETELFNFSIEGYYDLSRGVNRNENLPYTSFHNFEAIKISFWKEVVNFLKLACRPIFYGIILFELSQKTSLIKIYKLLKNLSFQKYKAEELITPFGYDLYHCHFCIPENLMQLYFLPKKSRIICSFWGSDLMRKTGVGNVFYVRKALKRAEKITVQSSEMAEMFYCKYGREFGEKVKILRFILEEKIFDTIDRNRFNNETKRLFKKKLGISDNKFIVAIGHNAFSENNHIKIIRQLELVSKDILNACVFILHLSYGGFPSYIEKLKSMAEQHSRMEVVVIEEFMGIEAMGKLRSITDLLIQMPVSDALSAAMTEVLYAGNMVIAGSWLPYDILRRKGVAYLEVESFQELPEMFKNVYSRRDFYKKAMGTNVGAIKKSFFLEKTTPEWICLFKSET